MKTLTELMDNIKALQKGLDEVYSDIAELQEAERSKEDMPDIVDWLNYARQHPLTGHPLTTVNNLEIQEIYIKLLFTVAMCHIYLNHEISPLVYPCQIAASLGNNINGERLFKESLSLDSLTIRKCCEQIKGQGLDAYFLIDSLIITGKYEQDNHEKMDYIASLAAIMEVSTEKFTDILTLAKTFVEEPKEFVGRLMEVYTPESLFYLKSCTSFKVIETPICFVAHSETMRDCDEAICQFLPLSDMVSALFSNISFKNTAGNKLTFSNMKQLEFCDCEFKDFDHTVINAESIEEIIMKRVRFESCIYKNYIDKEPDGSEIGLWRYKYFLENLVGTNSNDPFASMYNTDLGTMRRTHRYSELAEICIIPLGLLANLCKISKIVMDDVRGKNCFAKHYVTFYMTDYCDKKDGPYISRGIPDYTENYLFKGISDEQIEANNCTWENCCELVERRN